MNRTTRKPTFTGHRQRLRQKATEHSLDSFLPHEVLELLLTYAIPRKDTKPLAWALLNQFGSLCGVLDADEKQLKEVAGIGPHAALFLRLIREVVKSYSLNQVKKKTILNSPQQVLAYCKASLAHQRVECLELLFLSVRGTLMGTKIVATGAIDQVMITPRQIVEDALKANAWSIILVHNHPSGDATPSQEDIDLTQDVIRAAALFNIHVRDHIIIGKGGTHYSLREHNVM